MAGKASVSQVLQLEQQEAELLSYFAEFKGIKRKTQHEKQKRKRNEVLGGYECMCVERSLRMCAERRGVSIGAEERKKDHATSWADTEKEKSNN